MCPTRNCIPFATSPSSSSASFPFDKLLRVWWSFVVSSMCGHSSFAATRVALRTRLPCNTVQSGGNYAHAFAWRGWQQDPSRDSSAPANEPGNSLLGLSPASRPQSVPRPASKDTNFCELPDACVKGSGEGSETRGTTTVDDMAAPSTISRGGDGSGGGAALVADLAEPPPPCRRSPAGLWQGCVRCRRGP